MVLGGGTLQYAGATVSTYRNFTLPAATTSTIDVTSASTNLTSSGAATGTNRALNKMGAGTLTLAGTNTYTGLTSVQQGVLLVNGSLAGGITVDPGATLGGTGTIFGDAVISGTHSPGNSPGLQVFGGNLTYQDGSVVKWELVANSTANRGASNGYDAINVTGNLTINPTSTMNLIFNSTGSAVDWSLSNAFWNTDQQWQFYSVTGTTSGAFTLGSITGDASGNTLISAGRLYAGFGIVQSGSDIFVQYHAVPEPSALLLVGLSGAALLLRRRRRTLAA